MCCLAYKSEGVIPMLMWEDTKKKYTLLCILQLISVFFFSMYFLRGHSNGRDKTLLGGIWIISFLWRGHHRLTERCIVIIIIGIQPLGRFGQRPELSQSTGIALVRCILGKFLGVVCHCFPPVVVLIKLMRLSWVFSRTTRSWVSQVWSS